MLLLTEGQASDYRDAALMLPKLPRITGRCRSPMLASGDTV